MVFFGNKIKLMHLFVIITWCSCLYSSKGICEDYRQFLVGNSFKVSQNTTTKDIFIEHKNSKDLVKLSSKGIIIFGKNNKIKKEYAYIKPIKPTIKVSSRSGTQYQMDCLPIKIHFDEKEPKLSFSFYLTDVSRMRVYYDFDLDDNHENDYNSIEEKRGLDNILSVNPEFKLEFTTRNPRKAWRAKHKEKANVITGNIFSPTFNFNDSKYDLSQEEDKRINALNLPKISNKTVNEKAKQAIIKQIEEEFELSLGVIIIGRKLISSKFKDGYLHHSIKKATVLYPNGSQKVISIYEARII